ncbi:MAG TPA: CPBP family glutamic-type intramembrane protease [Bryobacteraceae bacterium]|nr:CPBP family glutamic-type intramembrane protease [Bryobacteraceae bacterium]
MNPNAKPIRYYWITLAIGWALLATAAAVYARLQSVPATLAVPLALAFLAEYPFYLLAGFTAARERFLARGRGYAAWLLTLSALFPWLIYALGTHHYNFPALIVMFSIALLMSFWFVVFPPHPVTDLLYLALFAAIILLKVFPRIYPAPWPKIEMSALGHATLIGLLAFSFVGFRGGVDAEYRFMPNKREWLAGAKWFVFLLPVTGAAYWALGLVKLRPHPLNIGLASGTFFGILWITCIFEEFIFRGLLQPWITQWTSSAAAGIAISALLFGCVHLSFHGAFPNWRWAIVAAILGVFLALARRQTGGIQAGMVAHALTVTVWKTFLQ